MNSSSNCTTTSCQSNSIDDKQWPLALSILLLNAYAVLIFARIRRKSLSICLFLSITAADALIGLCSMLADISIRWLAAEHACLLFALLKYLNLIVAQDTLLLLAMHRYRQLNKPYRLAERITLKRLVLALSPWIYRPLYCLAIGLLLWHNRSLFTCIVIVELAVGLAPLPVNLLNIYGLLRRRARALLKLNRSSMSNSASESSSMTIERTSTLNAMSYQSGSKFNDTDMAIFKVQSRSKYSIRKDLRATLCISVMILVSLVCVGCASSAALTRDQLDPTLLAQTNMIIYVRALLNPIVLNLFNREFKSSSRAFWINAMTKFLY